jgi:conjugative transposon TraN protein
MDIECGRVDLVTAERVNEVTNIIRLTTQTESFADTTNLTVVCQDGKVFTYQVCYLPEGMKDVYVVYATNKIYHSDYSALINNRNTTELFFPERVIYCRHGNEEVLGIEYYNNFIKVATTFDSIPESNLFVVDAGGGLYEITFTTGTDDSYAYNFDNKRKYTAILDVNSEEMKIFLDKLRDKRRNIHSVGAIKNKMEMSLANLYVYADFMFFSFDIKNFSNIDYDIDFIKCFIRDKKTSRNAIQQEIQIFPVHQGDFSQKITGKSDNRFILIFNKFTIPDKKIMELEMFEKGGGRHMKIELLNEYLLNAQLLN